MVSRPTHLWWRLISFASAQKNRARAPPSSGRGGLKAPERKKKKEEERRRPIFPYLATHEALNTERNASSPNKAMRWRALAAELTRRPGAFSRYVNGSQDRYHSIGTQEKGRQLVAEDRIIETRSNIMLTCGLARLNVASHLMYVYGCSV